MKVSTDSCLFGAWLSKEIIPSLSGINNVFDIGSGTGLLMLMLAQEHKVSVEGIELDIPAYHQALLNIEAFCWKERLQLFQGDIRSFETDKQYDLIISNPPFYENDLRPSSVSKASAMHDATLNFEDLLSAVNTYLKPEGYCALLIPFHRFEYFKGLASAKGFHVLNVLHMRHQQDHNPIRSMLLMSRTPSEMSTQFITVKENNNTYTDQFIALLEEYYLYL
jgi:tRNA1Val (adenine37-N6)-methyltransferase